MNNSIYKGIGGWLILPLIGLIVTPFTLGSELILGFIPIFTDGTWEILTTSGNEAYHKLWAPVLVFETIGNLGFLAFSVYLLFLFFSKHYKLPNGIILFYLLNFAFLVFDYMLVIQIPAIAEFDHSDLIRDIARMGFTAAVWVPYFMKSERVKNTFKNGISEPTGSVNGGKLRD